MENEIFNELFNTFLGPSTIEDCLKSVSWLTADAIERLDASPVEQSPPSPVMSSAAAGGAARVKVEQYDDEQVSMLPGVCDRGTGDHSSRHSYALHGGAEPMKRYDISLLECLTKSEERAIKKARRKIKNKISAQESRRKKKEYIEGLERRVTVFSSVNQDLKGRLSELEEINREMQEKIVALTKRRRKLPAQCTVATQTEQIAAGEFEL